MVFKTAVIRSACGCAVPKASDILFTTTFSYSLLISHRGTGRENSVSKVSEISK
ncbi:MAG: hypothetical protein ACI4N4_01995 [Candidatus Fimenecus sp.]